MDSEETCEEVYTLLKNNYVEDDENMFRFNVQLLQGISMPKKFVVAPDFDENDVEHWLLPNENVVDSYLVESPENHEITDFCSFYTLPSSILGNQNYSTLKAAYSHYNVSTKTPLTQLMNDALIVANQRILMFSMPWM